MDIYCTRQPFLPLPFLFHASSVCGRDGHMVGVVLDLQMHACPLDHALEHAVAAETIEFLRVLVLPGELVYDRTQSLVVLLGLAVLVRQLFMDLPHIILHLVRTCKHKIDVVTLRLMCTCPYPQPLNRRRHTASYLYLSAPATTKIRRHNASYLYMSRPATAKYTSL